MSGESEELIDLVKEALAETEFELVETIGTGATCAVVRAQQKTTQQLVALKCFKSTELLASSKISQAEYDILRQCNCEYIVRAISAFVAGSIDVLALELVSGQDLQAYFNLSDLHEKDIDAGILRSIARQLLSGIQHLKAKSIVHRDIRLENVMFEERERSLKLIDFGLACRLDDAGKARGQVGCPGFMAPEMYAGDEAVYDCSVDIFAVGATLYVLVTSFLPFQFPEKYSIEENTKKCKLDYKTHFENYKHLPHLLKAIFKKKPNDRIKPADALRHPFLYEETDL